MLYERGERMNDKALSEFLKQWSKKDLYGFIKDREKIIADKDRRIAEFEEENAKLQEQLKNAIVLKHKKGDAVFIIDENQVVEGVISHVYIDAGFDEDYGREYIQINYDVAFGDGEEVYCYEVFSTEAEAQKHLEEHK